jgi:mersacidin/lichenicidin family type 2 lantibiotic
MSDLAIVQTWKNRGHHEQYDAEEWPANPAGDIELLDADLADIKGGTTAPVESWFMTSCQMVTACRSREDENW